MSPLRLGTRGSALALAQARLVAEFLEAQTEVVTIRTRDAAPLADKSRFVGEIERALERGDVDVGVHSAKDLPAVLGEGLEIAAVPPREEPRDAYVGGAASLEELPDGARVGTSSLRRSAQLLALRPDLEVSELRGNVDTRLRRLEEGDFDGVVLAVAGLRRLGRERELSFAFEPETMTPAPGQGALALEVRSGDERTAAALRRIDHGASHAELRCERAAVAALEASCHTPVGVHAVRDRDGLRVRGFCGLPDGSEWLRDEIEGAADDPESLGRELAARMGTAGARDILSRAERALTGAG